MTLVMYDAIFPATLPPGGDAYLGYVDGQWQTYPVLLKMFPGKPVIGLTVFGTLAADGADIEPGNFGCPAQPTAAELAALVAKGAAWLKNKLADPARRMPPVAYCSVDLMAAVVAQLAAIGVPRTSVLLLSAHYGWKNSNFSDPANEHICGPDSCTLIELPQDGTQWTDSAPGVGAPVDRSLLADHFFTTKKENDMLIIWGTKAAYLLSGGRLHTITSGEVGIYQSAGIPQTTGPVATDAEIAALLADFPPGNPVVTVPPVTVTVPQLNMSGTITPA